MNKLIINADDFGLCESVNESIIDCFIQKNITSATLMVNMLSTNHALELAIKFKLPIGLHFNLVRGKSLTGVSTLTDQDKNFFSRRELFKRILKKKINPNDIRAEFLAQLNFCADKNIDFTHFDSDNHTHFNPFIIKSLEKIIISKQIKLRNLNPLKFSNPIFNLSRFFKQTYFKSINLFFWKKNFPSNNFITSIYDLDSTKKINKKSYLDLIKTNYKNITLELMVHPYKQSKELNKFYKTNKEIEFVNNCINEHAILSSEYDIFSKSNYYLSNFKDLISL